MPLTYRRAPDVLWRRALTEVFVRLPLGPLHNLQDTAADVWDLLGEAVTIDEIVQRLGGRYDGARERMGHDVAEMLSTLESAGLAVASPETPGGGATLV